MMHKCESWCRCANFDIIFHVTERQSFVKKPLIFTTRAPLRSGGVHLSRDNLRWNSCIQQIQKELSFYEFPSVRAQNTQWYERVGLTTTFSKIAVHTKQHRIHIPMQTKTQYLHARIVGLFLLICPLSSAFGACDKLTTGLNMTYIKFFISLYQ